jgi:hypothetical protein
VSKDGDLAHRGAGEFGRYGVGPGGQNLASDGGIFKQDQEPGTHRAGNHQHGGIETKTPLAQGVEGCGQLPEGLGLGGDQHGSGEKAHGGQGDYKAVNAGLNDQNTVYPAQGRTGQKAADNGQRDGKAHSLQ